MKEDYYTIPALVNSKPKELFIVEDFIIGRAGHGEILFPGKTNLGDIDLDKTVHIAKKSVVIYPDDIEKPPVGLGLNRPAIITLHQVWPKKKDGSTNIAFRTCLERVTADMGAEFIDYQQDSGLWKFRVPHFSKYGLNDSDEEIDPPLPGQTLQRPAQLPSRDILNGKDALIIQPEDTDLIPRPIPLIGEETVPKSIYYDSIGGLNDMEVENLDSSLRLLNDLHQIHKADITSHHTFLNFNLNNERFSGMKSTFFQDDFMDDENDKEVDADVAPISQKPRYEETTPLQHLSFQYSEGSRNVPLIPSGPIDSPFFRTPRRLASSTLTSKAIQYEKSLLFKHRKLLLDSGCFKNYSFKVGWDAKFNLVHKASLDLPLQDNVPTQLGLTSYSAPSQATISSSTPSTLQFSKLDVASISESIFLTRENMLENLQAQLQETNFEMVKDVPFFTPKKGVELLNLHLDVSLQQKAQENKLCNIYTIWNLCSALWGHCEESNNMKSYNYELVRKQLFSQWLTATTSAILEQEVQQHSNEMHTYLPTIFSQMTGNRIADACSKALELNDLRLGLLLAQAGSSLSNKNCVLKQLENWFQYEVDTFVDPIRLKIFSLLAGKLVWKTFKGTVINCCEDLDWKRALSVHLWFGCSSLATIQEAVASYEESFQGTGQHGQYASLPYPPYIQCHPEKLLIASQVECPPLDMCYHLLKLYCDRTTPLGKLLVPLTYGASQIDYSLSWMVFQVLESLGYSHLPLHQAYFLHANFASQLEAVGLWEWAVFVLLHISDALRRKTVVMEVLVRHLSLAPTEQGRETEAFLIDELHLPSSWLFAAKAILARYLGLFKEEAWCLLKSNQWSSSHRIVIEKIAPECIINEQFDYLKSYLVELSAPESSGTILDWSTGGEVYLAYIHVSEAVEQMMLGNVKAYEIEKLHPKLISLSNRILNLQCQGAKGRLCQSEMSKKTVTLLRALLTLRRNLNNAVSTSSANHQLTSLLPKLPMPADYALQELRAMVRSYMLEITRTEQELS